jgi:hypothetical protein
MFFPLFLANGVTGVREMGGPLPRPIRYAGETRSLPARRLALAWSSRSLPGADFLKVYTGASRAAYFGIAVEAKKGNFPFVGPVPLEVGVDEASKAGQKGVEHPALPEGTSGI